MVVSDRTVAGQSLRLLYVHLQISVVANNGRKNSNFRAGGDIVKIDSKQREESDYTQYNAGRPLTSTMLGALPPVQCWETSHQYNAGRPLTRTMLGDLSPVQCWEISHQYNAGRPLTSTMLGALSLVQCWETSHQYNAGRPLTSTMLGDLSPVQCWETSHQ